MKVLYSKHKRRNAQGQGDNALAQLILRGLAFPAGISEYQLSRLILEKSKSPLRTIEELEESVGHADGPEKTRAKKKD